MADHTASELLEVFTDDELWDEVVARGIVVDTEWSCHPTPDGHRWMRFHDKNSVHMDGCHRLYVRADQP